MNVQSSKGTYSVYEHHYQTSTNQFHADLANCKLCGQAPIQPAYLRCKHAFCYVCLQNYVEDGQYTDSFDFPCPHCKKLSAPPWGIWHLSHKVLDRSHDELYQTWKYEAICDSCASGTLYATAGRRCTVCNINLCDTCSYAHSVAQPTQSHKTVVLISKTGDCTRHKLHNNPDTASECSGTSSTGPVNSTSHNK